VVVGRVVRDVILCVIPVVILADVADVCDVAVSLVFVVVEPLETILLFKMNEEILLRAAILRICIFLHINTSTL